MNYLCTEYYLLLFLTLILYYIIPKGKQWIALLIGSAVFYCLVAADLMQVCLFLATIVLSFLGARMIERSKEEKQRRFMLWAFIILTAAPLLLLKGKDFLPAPDSGRFSLIVPVGLSFYTLQIIAYLADVYRNKIAAQRSLFKYALFISFFPQIIQGPISRYDNLGEKLKKPHYFNYTTLLHGAELMMWGFFKKMVIADRIGTLVSNVYGDYSSYDGTQVLVAMLMYSIQIYTDFSGGIDVARGAAEMLDIELIENFNRPYFANSVSEQWRRWHMSLTNWMRDYVFFPITLSKTSTRIGKWARKNLQGNLRKQLPSYLPTFIVFTIIGIWHGAGWGYIVYGLYNSIMIILGMFCTPLFEKMIRILHIPTKHFLWKCFQIIRTYFIMAYGRCLARAATVGTALHMWKRSLHCFNFSDLAHRAIGMGLDGDDLKVFLFAFLVLFTASCMQERGIRIRQDILDRSLLLRWAVLLLGLACILIFGVYGPGFNAGEFIYRNF